MRAFVGLPVPEPWIAPLIRAQGAVPGGRKVMADDLHLTLAFLDDQPEERLEALHEMLEARPLPSATLQPTAFALLGSSRPRAVVLDLAPKPDLAALRDAVRRAARSTGMALTRERFRPHVTLLRFSGSAPPDAGRLPAALARLGMPELDAQAAGSATLWASTLTPDGPIYDPLATYRLAA